MLIRKPKHDRVKLRLLKADNLAISYGTAEQAAEKLKESPAGTAEIG
jgi:hypothetical protein